MARMWRPLAWTLLAMLMAVTLSLEGVHLQQSAALKLLADPTQSAAIAAQVLRLQSLSQALIVIALVLGAGSSAARPYYGHGASLRQRRRVLCRLTLPPSRASCST